MNVSMKDSDKDVPSEPAGYDRKELSALKREIMENLRVENNKARQGSAEKKML